MKPQPVVVTTICSLCDQPWEAHGPKPTSEDCIRLLKAALARRPAVVTWPVYPTVAPYVYPYWPTITCGSTTDVRAAGAVTYNTPAINATCVEVAA